MTETSEVRRDTLGRPIHTSRRGPIPGFGQGRNNVSVTVKLPPDLLEAADARPGRRSEVVRTALLLMLGGDADKWRNRYLEERTHRLRLEQKLARIRSEFDT